MITYSPSSSSSGSGAFRNAVLMSKETPCQEAKAAFLRRIRREIVSLPPAYRLSPSTFSAKFPRTTIRIFRRPPAFLVMTSLLGRTMTFPPFFRSSSLSASSTFLKASFWTNRLSIPDFMAESHKSMSLTNSCGLTIFVWSISSSSASAFFNKAFQGSIFLNVMTEFSKTSISILLASSCSICLMASSLLGSPSLIGLFPLILFFSSTSSFSASSNSANHISSDGGGGCWTFFTT